MFYKMLEALRSGDQTMEKYGQSTKLSDMVGSSGNGSVLGTMGWHSDKSNEFADGDLSQSMSPAVKPHRKSLSTGFSQRVKFVLRDKKRIEQFI